MTKINSIKFIDSLAEITRYRDREVVEHSLLKTLLEFESNSTFMLYQVLEYAPQLKLGMLAYAYNNNILTGKNIKQHILPADVKNALVEVIQSAKITTLISQAPKQEIQIIYPAFDSNEKIFAILIQSSEHSSDEGRKFIHGFLRIYSNYLELIEITKRDKLTGLLNRETLESEITRLLIKNNIPDSPEDVKQIVTSSARSKNTRPYQKNVQKWLCIIDIDYFKNINDQYGHIYGDEILILVARLLEKSVRECDKIFRFGGEEFVILINAEDLDGAFLAFERIRKVIASHQYAKIERLTVSIGGTEITQQNDPRDVIEAADSALYYSKLHGRDQVNIYEQLIQCNKIAANSESFKDSEIELF